MPAPMILGKEKTIPLIAMILLLIGTISAIYVQATQIDKDTIKINGKEYTIEQIFEISSINTIETDDGTKTGVALEDLIHKLDINCPECHMYTIKASDRYQQTVGWNILKTGVLTDYKKVYFPDTAHYLWVHDVIEIEVK